MNDPTDAARILSVLVRSDEEALTYFAARTQMATAVPADRLRWWQAFLRELVDHLERSDNDRLEALRAAVESARPPDPAPSSPGRSEQHQGPPRPPPPAQTPTPPPAWSSPGRPAPGAVARTSPWAMRQAPATPAGVEHAATSPDLPPPAPAVEGEASIDETGAIDLSKLNLVDPPLPFHGEARTPSPQAHLEARPRPAGIEGEASVDETAAIDLSKLNLFDPPMPFHDGGEGPPPPAVSEASQQHAGETSAIDPAVIRGALASYPLPTKLPMAVERYAALVARSTSASEAELLALHREYGVSDEAHRRRIDQEFSEAFSRDGALRQQFADHLRRWRDWLTPE